MCLYACVCQLKNLILTALAFLGYLTKSIGPFLKNRSNFLCNYRARLCSPPELRTYFISSADLVSGAHSTSNLPKHPQELISCISADSFICSCSLFCVCWHLLPPLIPFYIIYLLSLPVKATTFINSGIKHANDPTFQSRRAAVVSRKPRGLGRRLCLPEDA